MIKLTILKLKEQHSLDGMNIYDKSLDIVQLRAKVGMVFQKPNPFPKSIYDNVADGSAYPWNGKKFQNT